MSQNEGQREVNRCVNCAKIVVVGWIGGEKGKRVPQAYFGLVFG